MHDTDPGVYRTAVKALGVFGARSFEPLLKLLINRRTEPFVPAA